MERMEHRCAQLTLPARSRPVACRRVAAQSEVVDDLYRRPLWTADHRWRTSVPHEFERPDLLIGRQNRMYALALRCGCGRAHDPFDRPVAGRRAERLSDVFRRLSA